MEMLTNRDPATTSVIPEDPPPLGNYFVSAYPPFSAWEPSGALEVVERALDRAPGHASLGLYVHLPFCQKKCDYCYYLSYVGRPREEVDRYLETLRAELRLLADRPSLAGRGVANVYFGGGTPSLLAPEQVRALGTALQGIRSWSGAREVTYECAPRSVSRELLEALQAIGVTRVSLGVQSLDDGLLRRSGRIHLSEDVRRAVGEIQNVGFETLNLDLMTGLPGETWEHWKDTIRGAIDLGADSVTLYQTEIPHNTRLSRDLRAGCGADATVSWPEKRDRLQYGFKRLEQAGYSVVSGYSAVRDPLRHPFLYQEELWRGGDLLGLGVASFSFLGGVHYQNQDSLSAYSRSVDAGILPVRRARLLSLDELLVREFILRLKLGEVRREDFVRRYRADILVRFARPLAEAEERGWLLVSPDGVRLTREGLLRVDAILPGFYLEEHRGIRYA